MKFKKYITGLKGLSCVMIAIGHFLNTIRRASYMPYGIYNIVSMIYKSRIGIIIKEDFWLYLFFVISGYLLGKSDIKKFKQFFLRCVRRFIRLGLPVLFAYFIIYTIYLLVGFHNWKTISLFKNDWYQSFYINNYSLKDVLLSPIEVLIFGKRALNAPYWVLKDMFFSSIIIYCVSYILNKVKDNGFLSFVFVTLFLLVSIKISIITMSCFFGFVMHWIETNWKIFKKKDFFYCFVLIILVLLCLYQNTIYIRICFFICLILFIPKIRILNRIFSSKFFSFLGDISFGVYSFHWPIFCSLGSLIIIYMSKIIPFSYSFVIALIVSLILTIIVSILYKNSFEKFSNYIVKKISVE